MCWRIKKISPSDSNYTLVGGAASQTLQCDSKLGKNEKFFGKHSVVDSSGGGHSKSKNADAGSVVIKVVVAGVVLCTSSIPVVMATTARVHSGQHEPNDSIWYPQGICQ